MFVAVYRWRLRPGSESQFRNAWREATLIARDRYGSRGSALFTDQDGVWTAIARWPDRKAREQFAAGRPQRAAIAAAMAEATAEELPGFELDTVEDLWTA